VAALLLTMAASACGGGGTAALPTAPDRALPPGSPVPPPVAAPPGAPQVLVGAGDIAMCDGNAESTARLLDGIGGTVFTLGDNAYYSGTREEFRNCYDPTWGRHKGRTRPIPGNHDYGSPGAAPYFEYFGPGAGPQGLGYYSFDLGAWHVIALNSNIAADAASPQAQWLRSDLAASASGCTVAYVHHPLFTSGPNGAQTRTRDLWRILHEAGAEIVLSGHDHVYERFAPMDADGRPDPQRGVRQFVVGTGGAALYPFVGITPGSEARISAFGVLKLTLQSGRYDWQFLAVSGAGDAGSGTCH
jgi:3',5'-cyclic AMP phosphodiesterase CpdA